MRGRCLSAVGAVLAIALFTLAASPCTAVLRTVLENTASATLVIDAGHGGFDGGAVSERGVSEQAINLSVAQRVRALACFFGVQTVMTRTDEGALDYDPSRSVRENKVADIHARERIVQSISSPVFVSIHLNKFSDPQYHGAQVFYSANSAFGKPLAEALQSALISGCDPENRRQAKQAESSVYLMHGPHLPRRHRRVRFSVQSRRRDAARRRKLSQKTCCLHRDRLSPVHRRPWRIT